MGLEANLRGGHALDYFFDLAFVAAGLRAFVARLAPLLRATFTDLRAGPFFARAFDELFALLAFLCPGLEAVDLPRALFERVETFADDLVLAFGLVFAFALAFAFGFAFFFAFTLGVGGVTFADAG